MAQFSSTSPVSRASPPTSVDMTPSRPAPPMATTFNLLLVLAAVLAGVFGWSPIQGIPSFYIIVTVETPPEEAAPPCMTFTCPCGFEQVFVGQGNMFQDPPHLLHTAE